MFFIPLGILFHTDVSGDFLDCTTPSDAPPTADCCRLYSQVLHRCLPREHCWSPFRCDSRYLFLPVRPERRCLARSRTRQCVDRETREWRIIPVIPRQTIGMISFCYCYANKFESTEQVGYE